AARDQHPRLPAGGDHAGSSSRATRSGLSADGARQNIVLAPYGRGDVRSNRDLPHSRE
ncbi:MAG: hypothetical protein QOJ35_3502, partial [Solirubrobacteraceae bacterium]|nr:hypothetical protein [Solirubrobacteraceae bacterium]